MIQQFLSTYSRTNWIYGQQFQSNCVHFPPSGSKSSRKLRRLRSTATVSRGKDCRYMTGLHSAGRRGSPQGFARHTEARAHKYRHESWQRFQLRLCPDSLGFEVESQDGAAYVYDGPFAECYAAQAGACVKAACRSLPRISPVRSVYT